MKRKIRIIGSLTIAAVSAVILGSCSADPDSAGLEYMPDMYRSPAIEPYVDYGEVRETRNEDAKLTVSVMTPPSGTIPYYGTDSAEVAIMLPYWHLPNKAFLETHGLYGWEYTSENTYELAAADKNPLAFDWAFEVSEEGDTSWTNLTLNEGKRLFKANCVHCHGEKGQADGPMMKSGAYTGAADLTIIEATEGQQFYSIYYGKGAMGAHGPTLDKKEIWTLVHYIQNLRDSNYGSKDAPEATEESDAVEGDETTTL